MGHIDRIGIKVRPFDHKHVSRELEKMHARITRASREGLLFTDPIGLTIELQPV